MARATAYQEKIYYRSDLNFIEIIINLLKHNFQKLISRKINDYEIKKLSTSDNCFTNYVVYFHGH
jgi:hypothetical protein